MTTNKYTLVILALATFLACNDPDDIVAPEIIEELPELTAGTADFSTYVAVGASFTAGFTDNALFKAAQENSFSYILSQQF